MRGRDLLQDMEYIDDKLVEEAAQISSKEKKSRINQTYLLRYGSIAACLAVVVVGSGVAIQQHYSGEQTESAMIADTAMQYDTSTDTSESAVESANVESARAHLYSYDSFEHYNEQDFYHGFNVSEVEREGALYYEFYHEEKDVLFYVNAEQTQGTLIHEEKEVTFDIQGVIGGTSAQGDIFLMDLTSDGKDEFIYYYTYGTGSWETEVLVYDIETMMPYELQMDVSELAKLVTMKPVEALDAGVRYEICLNGAVQTVDIGTSVGITKDTPLEEIAEKYRYQPEKIATRIEIDYENGHLYMNCGLVPSGLTWFCVAELNADYIWDVESQSFVIDIDTAELVVY